MSVYFQSLFICVIWLKKKKNGIYKEFLHVVMSQSNRKYLFSTFSRCAEYQNLPLLHRMAKNIYIPFMAVAFIPLLNGKLEIKS